MFAMETPRFRSRIVRAVVGEFLLDFLFVFTSIGSHNPLPVHDLPHLEIKQKADPEKIGGETDATAGSIATPLANAMMVANIASARLHISSAHLNPEVTNVMLAG
ncbi:hypothetical protein HPP92_022995 [Vanilla planifolia]|uniref:Uncharacterized protein n=1 Tax=Vanilla planifolia TaxID=51239 RepID=A0A835Q1P3_VANPL|nr:hypothetical protein HPP92_023261 [Vanilla planifolia]KAG0459867.1 hypothetical protein HPP92_022995 [Vanilla planifolia]